ncbi:hypothetical protein [Streptomyces sp. NPDC059761]|uniref:hypothetical protein n=1 Tax=Streptomyces sp. NPDC059761 TaxID=3346937 RepID=UPI003666FD03
MKSTQRKTLRRASFIALSVLFTTVFGVPALAIGLVMVADGPDHGALEVMAALLGVTAFCRRIAGSRIVLDQRGVSVINPLFTYDIPYRNVARVENGQGSLLVTTTQAVEILSVGYAGSIIDSFVGSTDKAVAQVKAVLAERRDLSGDTPTVRRLTRAWVADGCAIGMLVCILLALTVGS